MTLSVKRRDGFGTLAWKACGRTMESWAANVHDERGMMRIDHVVNPTMDRGVKEGIHCQANSVPSDNPSTPVINVTALLTMATSLAGTSVCGAA